jgi:hypothetical protein
VEHGRYPGGASSNPQPAAGDRFLSSNFHFSLGVFMKNLVFALFLGTFAVGAADSPVASLQAPQNLYSHWSNGPSADPSFFPIAVWLQSPANAPQYLKAGFNTFVGLWNGPTEEQLATLKKHGMKVICEQNAVGLKHLEDPIIIGWMHGDEPDNAQSLGVDHGYGPPIFPAKIIADYQQIRAADPSRPVMLNLGQGVAWDGYYGRGVRTNHPEDYPEYIKGCDLVSFDIYPVTHESPQIAGKLWYVPRGVERLSDWSRGTKIVWNCLECTAIDSEKHRPTPQNLRSEAWMSLIHGTRGLIYFAHEFKPKFVEAGLLKDPEMLAAAAALNHQITSLAPVLNSPSLPGVVTVQSRNADVPIARMTKHFDGTTYVFAVGMRDGRTEGEFQLQDRSGEIPVEVLGENRILTSKDGRFTDAFGPWDVRIYKIADRR